MKRWSAGRIFPIFRNRSTGPEPYNHTFIRPRHRCFLLITHFGSVNQKGSKCRRAIAWKLSLFSLWGKTGFRQFQAIVVTWDDTSCLFWQTSKCSTVKSTRRQGSYEFRIYKKVLYIALHPYKYLYRHAEMCLITRFCHNLTGTPFHEVISVVTNRYSFTVSCAGL